MAKQGKVSAQALFEQLGAAGTSSLIFTGMIKPKDSDDTVILFALAGDCSKWVEVSTNQIEDIQFIQSVHCQDHAHPLVHLFMKEPTSIEGKTFAGLARVQQTARLVPSHPAFQNTLTRMTGLEGQPGATPCYFDFGQMRWRCPPFS